MRRALPSGRPIRAPASLSSDLAVSRLDDSHSKELDEAGTEEEGYGDRISSPTWGAVR
jgi:hypothetical protein